MAEHLGGAALAQYQEEINALAEAGQRANALGKGGLSGQTPAELEGVDACGGLGGGGRRGYQREAVSVAVGAPPLLWVLRGGFGAG